MCRFVDGSSSLTLVSSGTDAASSLLSAFVMAEMLSAVELLRRIRTLESAVETRDLRQNEFLNFCKRLEPSTAFAAQVRSGVERRI